MEKLKEKNEQREKLIDSILDSLDTDARETQEVDEIFEIVEMGKEIPDKENAAGTELALRDENTELGEAGKFAKKPAELPPRKIHFLLVFLATLMLFFSVIGVIHSIEFVSRKADDISTRRILREEFEMFLYPVVIHDPPAFESVGNLPDSVIIRSAIWRIVLIEDKERYDDDLGVIYIPEADVERAARTLFGTGTLVHQSVSTHNINFVYLAAENRYQIPDSPSLSSYTPLVTEVTNVGDTYTVTVDYMLPGPMSAAGIQRENEAIKTMIYTVTRTRERMTIDSIQVGEFNW